MALSGQASGGWTESSSALRLLHVQVRNANAVLSDDAFTQTNPPIVTTTVTISTNVDTEILGVLSGSIAFTRPDQGSNICGGPVEPGGVDDVFVKPIGLFINTAVGNAYENTPGVASGQGPYVSAMGTFGSRLFETQALAATTGGAALAQGDDLTWTSGQAIIASRNGYLMPQLDGSDGVTSCDNAANASQVANGQVTSTVIGVLRMPADATQAEVVFDQRI